MIDWRVRCAILCVLVLAGCAGLSENECRSTDWAQLGERDGISGNRPRIEVYDYQCGRYHLHAAENDYMDGWWIGNAEFVRRADSNEGTD